MSGDADEYSEIEVTPEMSPKITGPEDIEKLCNSNEQISTKPVRVNFSKINNCRYGNKWNLSRKKGSSQAVEGKFRRVRLPKHAILCSMKLTSKSSNHSTLKNFEYKDNVFLTVNRKIIVMSDSSFMCEEGSNENNCLKEKDGILTMRIKSLLGKSYAENPTTYCLGKGEEGNTCDFPKKGEVGPVDLNFTGKSFADLAFYLKNKRKLYFSLYANGDADDNDCFFSELDLFVSIKYIENL